jgi:hypothetical protein
LPDDDIVSDQRADHQRRTNELDWLEMMSLRDPNREHGDRNKLMNSIPLVTPRSLLPAFQDSTPSTEAIPMIYASCQPNDSTPAAE